jgi:hypothetical protein
MKVKEIEIPCPRAFGELIVCDTEKDWIDEFHKKMTEKRYRLSESTSEGDEDVLYYKVLDMGGMYNVPFLTIEYYCANNKKRPDPLYGIKFNCKIGVGNSKLSCVNLDMPMDISIEDFEEICIYLSKKIGVR